MHAHSWIRTRNPSNQAATNVRRRRHGKRNRQTSASLIDGIAVFGCYCVACATLGHASEIYPSPGQLPPAVRSCVLGRGPIHSLNESCLHNKMIIELHPVDAGIMHRGAWRKVRRYGSLGSVTYLIWLRNVRVRYHRHGLHWVCSERYDIPAIAVHYVPDTTVQLPSTADDLTHTLLTWRIWWAPNNANRWQMGFNPYPANVENMVSS